jgi:hypothetical protein
LNKAEIITLLLSELNQRGAASPRLKVQEKNV